MLVIDKCKRAFERRYGKSLMPLETWSPQGPGTVHVKDTESGAWAVYDTTGWRIRLIRCISDVDL